MNRLIKALSISALALASSAGAEPQLLAPNVGKLAPLVEQCRTYVRLAYRDNDTRGFDDYVKVLLADPRFYQSEIVACGAYLLGAMDMAEGRIVPRQPARK